MKTPEEKKAAQAAAHRKWRESEKGKEYYLRRKIEKAVLQEQQKGASNGDQGQS